MPDIAAYLEITADYQHYLQCQSSSLSVLRNLFTGTFYGGRFSRYAIRDWLAGGVKNNFLFGWLPTQKSDHANFIFLIDSLCKLHPNAEVLLKAITDLNLNEDEDQNCRLLLDILFVHFEKIQQCCEKRLSALQEGGDKEEIKKNYAQTLRNVKISMNNLAQQHKVLRRITLDENDKYIVCGLLEGYYSEQYYKNKIRNREIKTSNKRIAKVTAFLAAIGEGFINFTAIKAGLLLLAMPALFPFAIPIAGVFFLAGFYSHYYIYKQNIYKSLKEIRRDRFYDYFDKHGHRQKMSFKRKVAVNSIGLLSVGAGFCGWALASYSISMAIVGTLSIPVMLSALVVTIPIFTGLTFMNYCTIVHGIRKWDENWEKCKKYFGDIKGIKDIPRVLLDFITLALSLTMMITLGMVAYVLFRGKGINVLTTWNVCTQASALIIATTLALVNSLVKIAFGLNKVSKMFHQAIRWAQSKEPVYNNLLENKGSVDSPSPFLNRIQLADQRCTTIYKWKLYFWSFLNAGSKGVLYGNQNVFGAFGTSFVRISEPVLSTAVTTSAARVEAKKDCYHLRGFRGFFTSSPSDPPLSGLSSRKKSTASLKEGF
ncbi:MAG: hypothetical protein K0S27_199 [Gammaproteobacteria bacterium]|jgi:hypothetical protein|nr:hypothetical protein [Gammaproteobacteria bacterium]